MKFLTNEPAAVIGKKLILCELHFGIELTLQTRGVHINLDPTIYSTRVNQLKQVSKTTELIVIGDFKDNYGGFEQRERNYFNELINQLKFSKITVVKGNHDSRIEEMAKNSFPHFFVEPPTGMTFTHHGVSYGLFHGHAAASANVLKSDYLLMGHNHAGVQIGKKEFAKTLAAWIIAPFGKKQKLVCFPSFNPLSGAVPFNAIQQNKLHGPIFKDPQLSLEEAEVILLNGQRIGKLKHLRT